ncbi:hypothetical protein APHNP_1213 [Anaplasma phagocytophilum str. ApNP]|uniref:Uncharacterized protein n=1 Tax=Anaplasma phagocytophilum str. ApNP TaxID=1359153 RepID=A0A0F3NEJ8_ANAPH|nr:hypothetical protein APHNP_1213 [Anaplasma phagocytophilum str. ApNP]
MGCLEAAIHRMLAYNHLQLYHVPHAYCESFYLKECKIGYRVGG